jgi:Outer membrane protein beta-barrel domain
MAEFAAPEPMSAQPTATPASAGSSAAGAQSGGEWHSIKSNLQFEAGGGFNAPQSNAVTYGGNFTIGGGLNFGKRLGLLAEYQFIDDKLPGAYIAEAGATGGHDHIWSFTLDPVVDLFPKSNNDIYITGGGGFYRKVTSFTDPEEAEYCEYYYCGVVTENEVVGHFSSNQGGWNIGGGFQHRLGGMYGDSKTKLFVEARYLDVLSPAIVSSAGPYVNSTTVAADTKLIPITLGVRF